MWTIGAGTTRSPRLQLSAKPTRTTSSSQVRYFRSSFVDGWKRNTGARRYTTGGVFCSPDADAGKIPKTFEVLSNAQPIIRRLQRQTDMLACFQFDDCQPPRARHLFPHQSFQPTCGLRDTKKGNAPGLRKPSTTVSSGKCSAPRLSQAKLGITKGWRLDYRPRGNRWTKGSGRWADRMRFCTAWTSYGTRQNSTTSCSKSAMAKAARGSPSRGCPIEPGFRR